MAAFVNGFGTWASSRKIIAQLGETPQQTQQRRSDPCVTVYMQTTGIQLCATPRLIFGFGR